MPGNKLACRLPHNGVLQRGTHAYPGAYGADPGGAVGGGAPRVSPAGTGSDGRLSGEDGGGDPADLCTWRVGPARADAPAAGAQPPEPPGPSDEDQVACADHGALSPRGRRGHVSGAVSAGRPPQERPSGGVRRRLRHLHLSRAAGGGRRGACLSPTDDVARGRLSAAVAPPCPGAADAGGAVVWPLPSCPPGGIGPLPRRPRATAGGAPTSPGLADSVCAAGGSPSRAVSHLRAAARVHRRDPAWRCAPTGAGWGARGMRPTRDRRSGEVSQETGVSGGGPVVSLRGQGSSLGGSASQVCGPLPPRGGGQGLWQAAWRGGTAAQTP